MSLTSKIAAIRTDTSLSEQDRVWKALALIAEQLDEDDDLSILGSIFGAE